MTKTALNQVIDVEDVTASPATSVIVPEAQAGGYLGFYRSDRTISWNYISVFDPPGTIRDYYRTPYPLFESREQLIEHAKKMMPNGGELRIVKVQL